VAQRESVVEPDRVRDYVCWEAMPVEVAGAVRHGSFGGRSRP
jgi:hypothetical protein